MKIQFTINVVIISLMLITGCGGGGDSSSKNSIKLNLTPSSIEETAQQGSQLDWSITARVSGTIEEQVYVKVVDPYGVLSTNEYDFNLEVVNSTTYILNMRSNSDLSPGEHSSNIQVQLCKNSTCTNQFSGSPWNIPVNLTIASNENLTTLSRIDNFSGWTTGNERLNNSHYVPVTLDSSSFSSRWLRENSQVNDFMDESVISQLVVQDNVLMFIERLDMFDNNLDTRNVVAISEETGELLWSHELDKDETTVQSFVADGKVNVITNYASYSSYDINSGVQHRDQALSQDSYLSTSTAMMFDSKLYVGGIYDYHNRIIAYDPVTDAVEWSVGNSSYNYGEESSIVADQNYVYYYDASRGLVTLDRTTGAEINVITDPNTTNNKDSGSTLLVNDKVITLTPVSVYGSKEVAVYDVTNNSILWAEQGEYFFSPVVKGDELILGIEGDFGANEFIIQSKDLIDGSLNWQASIPTNSYDKYNMIVTDNLILIGLKYEVIAFDIASQQVVWTYQRGGELIMSEYGVLYIRDPRNRDGAINAVNLQ